MPSWIALLIAVTGTAIGYGIDAGSGHKELTSVFTGLYLVGCVVAVLAVRHEGLFTAVIQPPLILFCAVPGAYWLFHGGKVGNVKDLLINCGYPLIERFPLMLGTAGGILAIGLVRWYFEKASAASETAGATGETAGAAPVAAKSFFLGGVSAKLNSLLGVDSDHDDPDDESDSKHVRSARSSKRAARSRTGRAARSSRSTASTTRARSRHARPSLDDQHEAGAEPRRRRRQAPPRDYDSAEPPPRSARRPRPQSDPDPRGRRDPYQRSAPRTSRFDDYDRYEQPAASFNRYAPYEPYEPYDPPSEPPRRRRPAPNPTNGANPTHHPISQVRYRGSSPDEPRGERRGRSRTSGRPTPDSWEYDV